MFRRTFPITDPVTARFEGREFQAQAGESVAAALLSIGVRVFRHTPVSESGRAPYCLIGHCFECLVEIDGVPNQQACLTVLTEGMDIRVQRGTREGY